MTLFIFCSFFLPPFFTSFELCFLIPWPGLPEINPQLINQSVTYNSPLQFNCSLRGFFDLLFQIRQGKPRVHFCHLLANFASSSVPLFPPPFHLSIFTIPGWRTEQGWWYSCFLVFMKLSSWVRIKAYWISNFWQDVQLEWSQVSILSMIFTIKRFTLTVLVFCLCSFEFQCTILILWSTFARLSTDCIFLSLFIITF